MTEAVPLRPVTAAIAPNTDPVVATKVLLNRPNAEPLAPTDPAQLGQATLLYHLEGGNPAVRKFIGILPSGVHVFVKWLPDSRATPGDAPAGGTPNRAAMNLEAEADILARLPHDPQHLPSLIESGNESGPFVTQTYFAFDPLSDLLRQLPGHRLDPDRALVFAHELALLLETLHAHGILHCDLKPSNILMRDGRHPVLVDFGAAVTFPTTAAAHVGTLGYASPELCRGESISGASDVFSWAAVVAEASSGTHPIPSHLWNGFPRDVTQDTFVTVGVPPELATAVRRGLLLTTRGVDADGAPVDGRPDAAGIVAILRPRDVSGLGRVTAALAPSSVEPLLPAVRARIANWPVWAHLGALAGSTALGVILGWALGLVMGGL